MSSGVKERLRVKQEALQAKLQKPFVQFRELEEKAEKTVEELNREVATYVLKSAAHHRQAEIRQQRGGHKVHR